MQGILVPAGTPHEIVALLEREIRAVIALPDVQQKMLATGIEPEGGSPSGAPTGPVVFTGKLIETVPPSAPAR